MTPTRLFVICVFMKRLLSPFSSTFKPFRTLNIFFLQNRWVLVLGIASLLLVDGLQLVIPLVIKKGIDLLTKGEATTQALLELGLIIVGIALVMALFRYVWRYCIFGHSRKVEEGLRNRLYGHLQELSPSFYHRNRTGDLMAISVNDINAVRMATGMGLVALTDGVILGMAALGFMISISLKLTLISIIPAPIIIVATRKLTGRMSAGFENVQKAFSELTERVREAFSGIRVIKAYTREEWELQRVEEKGENLIGKNMDLAKTLALFFPMMTIFTNAGLAIVIWLGGRLAILGIITIGDFVAFTSYLNMLTWPLMAMGWVTNLIQRGSASMRRINRILEEVPEIQDSPCSIPIKDVQGEIRVRDLSFRYPGQDEEALKAVNLEIAPGETVALAGRVGCGKSTLLQVIPRLLEVPSGTVFLDGRDITRIRLKGLRTHIGYVPQEAFIFSDSVRDNVLFGREGITEEELKRVLQIAEIYQEVNELEKGLHTHLGEKGVKLSGGQRQRLTLARALVSDPQIFILDDALSMVDVRTEERILNRLMQIRKKKTNLIVSHRISTMKRADRIIALEEGMVKEEGTHGSLLKKGGLYASLYESQTLEGIRA